jgi:hypothetical protein
MTSIAVAKQMELRKHIERLYERKEAELREAYQVAKKRFEETEGKRIEQEIRSALEPLLSEARQVEARYGETAKRMGYTWNDDITVDKQVPEHRIESLVEERFEETFNGKKKALESALEDKKLEVTEKILFADEEGISKVLAELKSMKVEL